MMDTDLRIQDLSQVKVSDLDLDTGSILVSDRNIKISPRALLELQDYLQYRPGLAYLLEGRCGKLLTTKWERCILEVLMRKEGLILR
jgi:integrase